jgi:hypothetical protein
VPSRSPKRCRRWLCAPPSAKTDTQRFPPITPQFIATMLP